MTDLKSFNITTAAEADTALEGCRVRMDLTYKFLDMALDEALDEIRNLANTNKPETYIKADRYCGFLDYSADRFRSVLTNDNYRDTIIREFSRHKAVLLNVKEDHVGTTNEDVAKMWLAFFSHGAEINKASRNFTEAASDYQRVSREYMNHITDTKQLMGVYINASTGRRNARGWVVKGRGDTIYVLKDPWPLSPYDMRQHPGGELVLPTNIVEPENDLNADANVIRFTRSKTDIEVIMPRAVSKQRRVLVQTWWAQYKAAEEAGTKLYAARAAWTNRGGHHAKKKHESIKAEALAAMNHDPVRSTYGRDEAWAKGVVAVMASDPNLEALIKNTVVKEFVKRAGGPLSEAEQKLVDEEPKDVPVTLKDAMREALENIRNPKPVVVAVTEEEEAE